ncbi:hypothetical protein GCM10008171_15030 [Methylopila jiangsuensis]|uniref:DUF1476 domain-containing protein n=1 Tax=Methylopila jiangsuensis TaxID=586230 RepID=A0A9W6JI93_9HYPH|nr:DUF1476 domain-containing protein [Methylopila jiangsuensis]MDR6284234.1 hypothetical protein [Methylopila jiangsuensis]GLK76249.1 hypothetical protein GCM10008171_15030 [Methylopila jiangsuensis]
MTTFDERERAFENLFAHDAAIRFRAYARRNRLLGLWAAEQLGKTGEDAERYAKTVVMADFEEVGDEDVLRKVSGDFACGGLRIRVAEVRARMDELLAEALEQVKLES